MSFLDDVAAISGQRPTTCHLPGILADLDAQLAADIQTAIHDKRFTAAAVAKVGQRYGLTRNLVVRHRNGECKSCRS